LFLSVSPPWTVLAIFPPLFRFPFPICSLPSVPFIFSHPAPVFLQNLLSCLRQAWHLNSLRIYLIVDCPLIFYRCSSVFWLNGHHLSSGWGWGPILAIYPFFLWCTLRSSSNFYCLDEASHTRVLVLVSGIWKCSHCYTATQPAKEEKKPCLISRNTL